MTAGDWHGHEAPSRRLAAARRLGAPALAQTAPTADEIRVYAGLHEAAAKGDVTEIEKLVKEGERINIQDFKEPHAAARRRLYEEA